MCSQLVSGPGHEIMCKAAASVARLYARVTGTSEASDAARAIAVALLLTDVCSPRERQVLKALVMNALLRSTLRNTAAMSNGVPLPAPAVAGALITEHKDLLAMIILLCEWCPMVKDTLEPWMHMDQEHVSQTRLCGAILADMHHDLQHAVSTLTTTDNGKEVAQDADECLGESAMEIM